jgi:hypothetical protein
VVTDLSFPIPIPPDQNILGKAIKTIATTNRIIVDHENFNVLGVIPRYLQRLLSKIEG